MFMLQGDVCLNRKSSVFPDNKVFKYIEIDRNRWRDKYSVLIILNLKNREYGRILYLNSIIETGFLAEVTFLLSLIRLLQIAFIFCTVWSHDLFDPLTFLLKKSLSPAGLPSTTLLILMFGKVLFPPHTFSWFGQIRAHFKHIWSKMCWVISEKLLIFFCWW